MIANNNIKIKVHSKIIGKLKKQDCYKNVKIGDIISINIKLLSRHSHTKIDVICENCKKINNITYQDYNKITKYKKPYYCYKCKYIGMKKTKKEKYGDENYNNINKIIKTNLKKYGVENVSQINKIKEKKKKTCLKNYGVEIPAKSNVIIDRMKKTCTKRYGVDNPSKSEKIINKMKKNMY